MSCMDDHEAVRRAIQDALPDWDQRGADATLQTGFTYLPQSHALALDPDVTIVSGIRGSGKSHWYTYLANPDIQKYLVSSYKNLRITIATHIRQGFGTGTGASTPTPDMIKHLAAIDADAAWKCVLGSALPLPPPFPSTMTWIERTLWVRDNPELFEGLVKKMDDVLTKEGQSVLVLFDALDRIADDWKSIRPVAKSLFRLALDVRSYTSIRMKLFVRPDMLDDEVILAFPDASKLLARKQDLTWRKTDLYALLFQRLGNTKEFGNEFVAFVRDTMALDWSESPADKSRVLNEKLRFDEGLQAHLFHAMTGPTMAGGASGHKRGIPYHWLVNHLMDARDQVSPRSFFAALVEASHSVDDGSWKYALSPRSIQNGVVKASEIRKDEIAREDYPWVSRLMIPLGEKKLVVPCLESEIRSIWEDFNVINTLSRMISDGDTGVKLPPRRIADGPRGLIDDLAELGIMYRLLDGRIQIPDVFRIAYKLGRKGGVKPLK